MMHKQHTKLVQVSLLPEERARLDALCDALSMTKREAFSALLSSLPDIPFTEGLIPAEAVLDKSESYTIKRTQIRARVQWGVVFFDVLGNLYEYNAMTGAYQFWGTANSNLYITTASGVDAVDFKWLRKKLFAYALSNNIFEGDIVVG